MILITQGHERGIGHQAFARSLKHFSNSVLSKIHYFATKEVYDEDLKISELIGKLKYTPIPSNYKNGTIASIERALENIQAEDFLFTLPSSKDQFRIEGENINGHTDYFRKIFDSNSLPMVFTGKYADVVLLSDHIPLREVPNLNIEESTNKVRTAINFFQPKKIFFAGINPHAGENGQIGDEDNLIKKVLGGLQKDFESIEMIGPLSGDTLSFHAGKNALLIYAFHDQGLSYFKGIHKFEGLNITLGLPFLRASVDHGTAFSEYGRESIDISGMIYGINYLAKMGKYI